MKFWAYKDSDGHVQLFIYQGRPDWHRMFVNSGRYTTVGPFSAEDFEAAQFIAEAMILGKESADMMDRVLGVI